jgi:hypothetical protein
MDPFSITVGVTGLLALSAQIHQTVTKYIESAKNVRQEARDLVAKLTALVTVLEQLECFIKEHGASGHFSDSSVLYCTTK